MHLGMFVGPLGKHSSSGQGHKKVALQNPIQFDQVKLRCAHLAVLMHTRRLRGGVDEIELSLGLPLSKLYSDLHLQTKAMLETQRQAAIAHPNSIATQQVVQQRTVSTGKLVRQRDASCSSCLLKGSLGATPGCAGWAGWLCQPRQESGEGSGPVPAICMMPRLRPPSVVLEHHDIHTGTGVPGPLKGPGKACRCAPE